MRLTRGRQGASSDGAQVTTVYTVGYLACGDSNPTLLSTAWPLGALRLMLLVRRVVTRTHLVDPASSHMLVSKIKPCMSKYKRLVL